MKKELAERFKLISDKTTPINEQEYFFLVKHYMGENSSDEYFQKTDLKSVVEVLDRVNFKPTIQVVSQNWNIALLLDKDLISFVKKFEEKILWPASDLIGEIKFQEHQTLIFNNILKLSPTKMCGLLQEYKNENFQWEDYNIIKEQLIEFLFDINKGTDAEKLECLVSVDKLLVLYPETHGALSKLCGFDKKVSYLDMIIKLTTEKPNNNMKYLEDFNRLIETIKMCEELDKSLTKNKDSLIVKKNKI